MIKDSYQTHPFASASDLKEHSEEVMHEVSLDTPTPIGEEIIKCKLHDRLIVC